MSNQLKLNLCLQPWSVLERPCIWGEFTQRKNQRNKQMAVKTPTQQSLMSVIYKADELSSQQIQLLAGQKT